MKLTLACLAISALFGLVQVNGLPLDIDELEALDVEDDTSALQFAPVPFKEEEIIDILRQINDLLLDESAENVDELLEALDVENGASAPQFAPEPSEHEEMFDVLEPINGLPYDEGAGNVAELLQVLPAADGTSALQFAPVPLKEEEVIDILKEIWSHVPMDDLFDLIISYMIDDEDFQSVVGYMMGDEFKNTLVDVEKLKEIKALLKFLKEVGVDIYEYINVLHDLIGLEPIKPLAIGSSDKITGGLPGLIKDIRALLPVDYLYKYYEEKMKTSQKFREFVKRLETRELQDAVTALNKHKGFNSWLTKLEKLGVDLDELIELIEAIIGIKVPPRPRV